MAFMPIHVSARRLGIAFLQPAEDETNATIYTFSAQNLGAGNFNRLIICGVFWTGDAATRTISSATIGGVTATIVAQTNDPTPANPIGAGIIQAAVPSGASGDVAITFSGGCLRAGIALWRAVNLKSTTATGLGTDLNEAINLSVNVSEGGVAVAVGHFGANFAVTTSDDQSKITENLDQQFLAVAERICGASAQGLTASATYAPAFSIGIGADAAGVVAAWR